MEIEALLAQAVDFINQNAIEPLLELCDYSSILMLPEVPQLCGKENINIWLKQRFALFRFELEAEIQDIHPDECLAGVYGRFLIRSTNVSSKKIHIHNGNFVVFLRRYRVAPEEAVAARWRMCLCCSNSSLPPV